MSNILFERTYQFLKSLRLSVLKVSYSNIAVDVSNVQLKSLETSDRTRNKSLFKDYFIENLFLNKFEERVLEYPEIDTLKEVEALTQRCRDSKNLLASSSTPKTFGKEIQPIEVINNIKKWGLSGFKVPIKEGGFGYLNSEFAYLQEALDDNFSLARIVSENENFGTEIINNFGTECQKNKYAKSLSSGESMACFAHLESDFFNPFDPAFISTKALYSDDNSFMVSGQKKWVYNANYSNLIIFSASASHPNQKHQKSITLFIVDKNLSGITIHEPIKTIGLKGAEICDITFSNLVVPNDCVLGKVSEGDLILKKIFATRELNNSVQCLSAMKKLLGFVIQHCLHNIHFKKYKCEEDYYLTKVGKLVGRIYVLESMAYLVAGRMDSFINSDLFLESLILKIFSTDTLQYVLPEVMEIVGLDVLTANSNDLISVIEDCYTSSATQYSDNFLRLILSTTGFKHFLNNEKNINPVLKLVGCLKNLDTYISQVPKKLEINSKKKLKGYLHLMFEEESKVLEDMVLRLYKCCKYMFNKYGDDILNRQMELNLLANLVIDIYSLVALLGRASRAYCLGARNQEVDRSIVKCETLRIHIQFVETEALIKNSLFIETSEKISWDTLFTNQMQNPHPIFEINNFK